MLLHRDLGGLRCRGLVTASVHAFKCIYAPRPQDQVVDFKAEALELDLELRDHGQLHIWAGSGLFDFGSTGTSHCPGRRSCFAADSLLLSRDKPLYSS